MEAMSIAPLVKARRPECCLCSPLMRCIQTAECISGLPPEINPDLREIDFGLWEGLTFDEIQKRDPAAVNQWDAFDPDFSFPEGERPVDFAARVQRLADTLVSRREETILAITHSGVIRALICYFLGLHPRQYVLFNVDFASLAILDLFGDRGILAGFNIRRDAEEI